MAISGLEFDKQVAKLKGDILSAIETHFENTPHSYDEKRLLAAQGVNIEQLCRDAHFYGAEVFPGDHA